MMGAARTKSGALRHQSGTPEARVGTEPRRSATVTEITNINAKTIASLRNSAAGCKACDLWKNATQTVFGEGLSSARIMLVGEQPGDQEDRTGHPFVGPAGKLLDTL